MTSKQIELKHDGVARTTLVKEAVVSNQHTCSNCGSGQQLYFFGIKRDDSLMGKVAWAKGQFCVKSCYEAYHL